MSIFLNYLKDLAETEGERRKSLDNKAQHIVTISGTVVTLLFAFIAFLIGSNIPTSYFSPALANLIFAVVLAVSLGIAAMLFGILSLRAMIFPGGIDIEQFLNTKDKDMINNAIKDTFKKKYATPFESLIDQTKLSKNLRDDEYMLTAAAKAYISLIEFHNVINGTKARNLDRATWLIFACIVSIGLIAFFVWSYLPVPILNA